ncbi:hypothetical protein K440DRAFT_279586 [Wilcoxina mikolae CBS 423.85]|nr:hypothetical protein K440DRAFT_279586 [Wilcoxina mikolae CBS 423.85]
MATFGYSAGDFIAAVGLIAKITKALSDTKGASNEYQLVVIELQALERVLFQLEALKPNEANIGHINAVRAMALTCRLPLQDFINKLTKFEKSMGPRTSRNALHTFGRKAQWAVVMLDEVTTFRVTIAAKVASIHLLLGAYTAAAASRLERQGNQIQEKIKLLEKESTAYRLETRNQLADLQKAAAANSRTLMAVRLGMFPRLFSTAQSTAIALRIMRSRIDMLISTLQNVPAEILQMLRKLMMMNMEIYFLLLKIHESMPRSPTRLIQDNIVFDDALGRVKSLEFEYFRHWRVFREWLCCEFGGLPGGDKINKGLYCIRTTNGNQLINQNEGDWTSQIRPGMRLDMSVVMERLLKKKDPCPRNGCTGKGDTRSKKDVYVQCNKCGLLYTIQQARVVEIEDTKTSKANAPERDGDTSNESRLDEGYRERRGMTSSDRTQAGNIVDDKKEELEERERQEVMFFKRIQISEETIDDMGDQEIYAWSG